MVFQKNVVALLCFLHHICFCCVWKVKLWCVLTEVFVLCSLRPICLWFCVFETIDVCVIVSMVELWCLWQRGLCFDSGVCVMLPLRDEFVLLCPWHHNCLCCGFCAMKLFDDVCTYMLSILLCWRGKVEGSLWFDCCIHCLCSSALCNDPFSELSESTYAKRSSWSIFLRPSVLPAEKRGPLREKQFATSHD